MSSTNFSTDGLCHLLSTSFDIRLVFEFFFRPLTLQVSSETFRDNIKTFRSFGTCILPDTHKGPEIRTGPVWTRPGFKSGIRLQYRDVFTFHFYFNI